jgi:chloramphenicol-sensitive protein RarD
MNTLDSDSRRLGSWYALGAYTFWGVVPAYWHFLKAFPSTELVAHRIVWSFLFYWLLTLAFGANRFEWCRLLVDRKTLPPILFAGLLVAANWLIYIWAVNSGHVIDSSLGYFITPLLNVLMGAIVLNERLSRAHWIAVILASMGVLILSLEANGPPWIALALAFSFSTYGLIRKRLKVDVVQASTAETAVVLLPSLAFLVYSMGLDGIRASSHQATSLEIILIGLTGIVTGVPLLWFAQAAQRLPLSGLGFFQYIAPTIQFILGYFVFAEPFSIIKLKAFAFIWAGLAVFSWESLRRRR